jgi:hypothetical protein
MKDVRGRKKAQEDASLASLRNADRLPPAVRRSFGERTRTTSGYPLPSLRDDEVQVLVLMGFQSELPLLPRQIHGL